MRAETLVHIFSNFSQFTFFFIYFFIKKVDEKKVDEKKKVYFKYLSWKSSKFVTIYKYKDPSISYYIIM